MGVTSASGKETDGRRIFRCGAGATLTLSPPTLGARARLAGAGEREAETERGVQCQYCLRASRCNNNMSRILLHRAGPRRKLPREPQRIKCIFHRMIFTVLVENLKNDFFFRMCR